MAVKTPKYWSSDNIISLLLYPLSLLYGVGRTLHTLISQEYKSKCRVICIGNITAGGSGKTPLAIEIGKILKERRCNFAFLSKGYKGRIRAFTKVDPLHSSMEVGDEPLLLAEVADTFVCHNRLEAIKLLESNYKYDTIVMDDGFQNPSVHKDRSIVVIDGVFGFGNWGLLPAGPLREPISTALNRAGFFVLVGQDVHGISDNLLDGGYPFTRACIKAKGETTGGECVAFCGIGRASKFFDSLIEAKYKIIKKYEFEDHHVYNDMELRDIADTAGATRIITTKKDWVRLPREYKSKIDFLDIEMVLYNRDEFLEMLF